MADTLDTLGNTIAARRGADPASSYVASLFEKGLPKIAQKVGEEAVETVIAALSGDAKALTAEAADLLFHLLVLLEAGGVPLSDVLAELDRREGLSGIAEKASRTPEPPLAETSPLGRPISLTDPDEPSPGLARGGKAATRPLIRRG
jgi:phosphoribosyl-ATP pyrophosphohydrolase